MALRRSEQAYRKGVRLSLTISPQASTMIDELLATGLYGIHGRAGVAQELIYKALREHLGTDGLLRNLRSQQPTADSRPKRRK